MVRIVNYTLTRGVPFERLIMVKNRRNRRVIKPLQAKAAMRTASGSVIPIQATVTSEWGIRLHLDTYETSDLPVGTAEWDVLAYMTDRSIPSPYYELHEPHWQPVAKGIITVQSFATITSPEDSANMWLSYKQRTDLRRRFAWYGTGSTTVIEVDDAYFTAVDATGAPVMHLRWFPAIPNEATIAALPAIERGYLAPSPGYSLELHIADDHPIAPGEYRFSLMVNAGGDWDELSAGTLGVTYSPASAMATPAVTP